MSSIKSYAFIIDPFESLNPKKDTSLAMMRAALSLGAKVYVCEMGDLYIVNGVAQGDFREVTVKLEIAGNASLGLKDLDGVFMRKDPPIDAAYYACTQILSLAQSQGAQIHNDPQSLRDESEKLFALHFPDLIPETIVTAKLETLRTFGNEHGHIIVKPLNAMGGAGIFLIEKSDLNFDVIWETLTDHGAHPIMAQQFIPDIRAGDKRVLIMNGKPFDHMLVRTPKEDSVRGNMAAGATTHIAQMTDIERKIAEAVSPVLIEKGISFCGIDIIGDKLIEVNHTSPTGIVEISKEVGYNIAEDLFKGLS